jgi:EpsD family peptidyl-prolyl cis-trans isomerase
MGLWPRLFKGLACAVAVSAMPMSVGAQDAPQPASDTIALIGTSLITEAEVARISTARPYAYADLPADQRRARIIDTLVAEYVIDYHYGRDTQRLSPTVLEALNDARRQVLLQFFAQSRFTPPEISDEDVAGFAARHPELFRDRRSYSFAILTLAGSTSEHRQAVQQQVQNLLALPEPEIASLDAMVTGLQAYGVKATLNTVWQPSEALAKEVLLRLDAMVSGNRLIDISQQANVTSILLLNSAVPIPVEPAMLRGKIEQRLIAEAFDIHREKLVYLMAQTVLNETEVNTEDQTQENALIVGPPPPGTVVWTGRPSLSHNVRLAALLGFAVFGVLACYTLWVWLQVLIAQHRRNALSGRNLLFRKKRGTGFALATLGVWGLLAGVSVGIPVALQVFGRSTTQLALGGSVLTAIVIAGIWHVRSRRDHQSPDDVVRGVSLFSQNARKNWLRKQNSIRFLAAYLGFAILTGISLLLLLDGTSGLA